MSMGSFPCIYVYHDSLPHKVYGVSVTINIGEGKQAKGADSIIWAYVGRVKETWNEVSKSSEMIHKGDTFSRMKFTLLDYSKLIVSNTKGPILDYNNRALDYQLKARKYQPNTGGGNDTFVSDMVYPVYEFYFDSAHTFEANDTIIVGVHNNMLDDYFVAYFEFQTTGRLPLSEIHRHYSWESDSIGFIDMYNFHLIKGDIFTTDMPYAFNGYKGKYQTYYFPMSPIVELRCTTPKAVRWTAIGSDTARFEWQLHDEAENFIVEVEDMIANTTTHDTLPSWQNYYTVHGLDTNTDCLQLRVQKSTRYTMKYYDTVVYSPWYELPLLGHLPEPPDTTTPIDTTQPVDTNQGILMAQGLQFSLQPNPVHDKAEVQLAAPASEGCTATLSDLSGRELQRIAVPPATQSLTIDLATLPAGTYLLTLATPTASSTQRVMKGQ